MKEKITKEGQPCRKCSTPVVKRSSQTKNVEKKKFHYEYYFFVKSVRHSIWLKVLRFFILVFDIYMIKVY